MAAFTVIPELFLKLKDVDWSSVGDNIYKYYNILKNFITDSDDFIEDGADSDPVTRHLATRERLAQERPAFRDHSKKIVPDFVRDAINAEFTRQMKDKELPEITPEYLASLPPYQPTEHEVLSDAWRVTFPGKPRPRDKDELKQTLIAAGVIRYEKRNAGTMVSENIREVGAMAFASSNDDYETLVDQWQDRFPNRPIPMDTDALREGLRAYGNNYYD